MKNCLLNIIPENKINDEVLTMNQHEEIQMAFNLWELTAQLEALLWERYRNEFCEIVEELESDFEEDLDRQFPDEPEF